MLSFRRSFPASPEALSPGHPYSLDNSKKSCQVPFVEFRGNGPPSSNFGHPGDVYVDSTPSSYALYWRDRNGREPGPWRRWTALLLDQVPLYKYLVSHPWADDAQRSDLYLWVDPTGVSWTSRAEICASRVLMIQKNIATISPGERNPDVAALIAEILVKMIDAEDRRTLPPILERSQTSPTPYTSPSVTGRGRSQSSASHYSSPAALPQRDPRPSSPQSQYPSKRRNTITNPPQHERSTTRLSPLGATISPRLPPTAHPSRAKSPPHTHAPSSFRPSPYERPAPSPSPHPISPRITPSFSDHRPQPEHYRRETTYPAEYPATSSRRHESDDDDRNSPPSPGPPSNGRPPANEHENFAWTEMQRAQYAEAHFKRELRQKNRELAKFKKKEKDIISLSFLYQKKEQELLDALANAEKRSNDEVEKQREAVRAAQSHVEEAEQQTRDAVRDLRRLEDVLGDARKEIQRLKSYAEKIEVENEGLKDEMSKFSSTRSDRPNSRNHA